MKNPIVALSWELWRKNRFGFLLLLLLFGSCVVVTVFANRLQAASRWLAQHDPNLVILPAEQLLRTSPTGAVPQRVVLKLRSKVVFDGTLVRNDRFEIAAVPEPTPTLRIRLENPDFLRRGGFEPGEKVPGGPELTEFEVPLPVDASVTWLAEDGRTGVVGLAYDLDYPSKMLLASERAERWRSLGLTVSVCLFTFTVFALFAIFGAAEPTASRGFTGIPPRRFTLPVRTSALVFVPLVLGWMTLALLYLAWSHVVFGPLTTSRGSIPDLYLLLLLSGGLSSFQALVWGLPSFPRTRAFLLTTLVLALFIGAAIPFDAPVNRQVEPVLMGSAAVLWLGTVIAAWLGVKLERRGFWNEWARSVAAPESFLLVLPTSIQFAGPLHAQCWMEWRRNGRFSVAMTAVISVVLVACVVVMPLSDGRVQTLAAALAGVLSLAAAGWVGIAGLNLARDAGSRTSAMSSFTAVRPVSIGTVLEAKLIVGLAVWLIGACAFTAVWLGAKLLLSGEPVGWVVFWCWLLALAAHVFVGILPLSLSGRIPGFPWSFLPWLVLYGGIANVALWFGDHPNYLGALFWLCSVALLAKLLIAAWGFSRALRRRLISPVFVGVYSFLWLLVSSFLMRLALAEVDNHGWSDGLMALIPGAALIVPLARIAVSPVALASNRHR